MRTRRGLLMGLALAAVAAGMSAGTASGSAKRLHAGGGASASAAAPAGAATLTLVEVVPTNTYSPQNWVVDPVARTVVGTFPWGKGTYHYELPSVIPPAGAAGVLQMSIEANQRWSTGFSLSGDVDMTPPAAIEESTDARGLVFTSEKRFTITPRAYPAGTKIIEIVGHSYYDEGPRLTFRYSVAPASAGATFRADARANDVRAGPPLVGWFQLCLSRLSGSGRLGGDGAIAEGGRLFQFNKCPKRRGGPRTFDASVMWQVVKGTTKTSTVTLNYGDHGRVKARTTRLVAEVVQTYDSARCPVGTKAVITLRDDPRHLGNGQKRDRAEVAPSGSKCSHQGWSNRDNPNNDPPRGGPGGGQHAQITIAN